MARNKTTNPKSAMSKPAAKKPVTQTETKKQPVKTLEKQPGAAKGKSKRRASTESEDEEDELSSEGRKPSKRAKPAEESVESDVEGDGSVRLASKGPDNDTTTACASKTTLTGTFDLYAMGLPFLNKVYSPSSGGPVDPEKLCTTILTYQAKNDRTAKVTIPEGFSSGKDGKFRSAVFCDPFEEMPFDIIVTDIERADSLKANAAYKRPTKDAWSGPVIKARMELEDAGCGIASSSGSVALHPMWKKIGKEPWRSLRVPR